MDQHKQLEELLETHKPHLHEFEHGIATLGILTLPNFAIETRQYRQKIAELEQKLPIIKSARIESIAQQWRSPFLTGRKGKLAELEKPSPGPLQCQLPNLLAAR